MAERKDEIGDKLGWIESLLPPKKNEVIIVRHGESKYTGKEVDLTPEGINQIRETAEAMKDHLADFKAVVTISSPAPRAISSAKLFLEAAEIGGEPDVKLSKAIRPFDIKNLPEFLKYDQENSTNRYGEMWMTDPFLAEDNSLTEGRESVNRRAGRFLYHIGRALDRIAKKEGVTTAALTFTHMEIGVNFLQGITPGESFPIQKLPALENAEPIIIQLDDPQKDEYTVIARGNLSPVRYDPATKSFIKRD